MSEALYISFEREVAEEQIETELFDFRRRVLDEDLEVDDLIHDMPERQY